LFLIFVFHSAYSVFFYSFCVFHILCCLFPIFVQVYRPLPLRLNQIAANKIYHMASISHCTIQYISQYCTVYLTVLYSISHCTIQYISLYYTVYLTVLYSISHCTIQYISLHYILYLTGRFLYYFIFCNFNLSFNSSTYKTSPFT
jgi:hypothetical protein